MDPDKLLDQLSTHLKKTVANAISLAMSVHGAMGLSEELGLEELYRDARMLLVPDGTNEILALIIGRELTGIGAFRG